MDTGTVPPPPSARADLPQALPPAPTEIALFLKAWMPSVVTIVGSAAAVLAGWQLLVARVDALEAKVTQIETARQADRELLTRMDARIKLLLCRVDPKVCPTE